MKIAIVCFMLCASAAQAVAQQQPPNQLLDRVEAEIGHLVVQNTSLSLQAEQLTLALKNAQDRIKALEDKYEPKPQAAPGPQP